MASLHLKKIKTIKMATGCTWEWQVLSYHPLTNVPGRAHCTYIGFLLVILFFIYRKFLEEQGCEGDEEEEEKYDGYGDDDDLYIIGAVCMSQK